MEELESPTMVFEQMDDGDEITVETEYGRLYNREVTDETDPRVDCEPSERQFVYGKYERGEYLVVGHRGPEIKEIEPDGSLEVSGDIVLTIINYSQDTWAGENEELVD